MFKGLQGPSWFSLLWKSRILKIKRRKTLALTSGLELAQILITKLCYNIQGNKSSTKATLTLPYCKIDKSYEGHKIKYYQYVFNIYVSIVTVFTVTKTLYTVEQIFMVLDASEDYEW